MVAILLKSDSLALLRCLFWHLSIIWQLALLILVIKLCKHQLRLGSAGKFANVAQASKSVQSKAGSIWVHGS